MLYEGRINHAIRRAATADLMRQLRQLGVTTTDTWERAVFSALNGRVREDLDLDVEENRAEYGAWIRSFDRLTTELVADDRVRVTSMEQGNGQRAFAPCGRPPSSLSGAG
jgi:hypothetical protein